MADLLELADRLWRGDADIGEHHPVGYLGELIELDERLAFHPSFANVSAIRTEEGLVLVDSGSFVLAPMTHETLRGWTDDPLHTVIWSHGHVDHVFGVPLWEEEARERGRQPPRVIAHENMPARFERYLLTAGYNSVINTRQFQASEPVPWPSEFRQPDLTYRDTLAFEVGGERFELHHAKGETDDYTWTWIADRSLLCPGDLFIWATPNAGNPQKVQRYPREWAAALREMEALGAETMLPGHGLPVLGRERVKRALGDTAALLESIVEQTLELMNEGVRLNEIVHAVKAPEELVGKPYLLPIYDEPEFIVHNVWRLYGGWYDGNPAHLKPAPEAALAEELAALAGGAERLAERASELAGAGDLRLAAHLAELAALAAPELKKATEARAEVFGHLRDEASSTMARGIYAWAASESKRKLDNN
jgi:glyoxylase-like metal-dependent hydrolase (beta-lactamase superfamily II)